MRAYSGLLLLIFLSTCTDISGQTGNYELNQIGILGVGNHYAIDGGMGNLDLNVIRIKIRNGKVMLKGQLRIPAENNHPLPLYTIFVAENDSAQRRLSIIDTLVSKSSYDDFSKQEFNGIFEISTELKDSQGIYFEHIGYGMVEFRVRQ